MVSKLAAMPPARLVPQLHGTPGVIVVSFASGVPLEGGWTVQMLDGPERTHLNSRHGFTWWYAEVMGARPQSWRQAARAYARIHGLALVLHDAETVTGYFSIHGLTFCRDDGRLVWPRPEALSLAALVDAHGATPAPVAPRVPAARRDQRADADPSSPTTPASCPGRRVRD